MKKLFSTFVALVAVLSLSAQVKVDGVWYALYETGQHDKVVVGTDIYTYTISAPCKTTLTFDYKKYAALSINGSIVVYADGVQVGSVSNKSTSWATTSLTIPANTKSLRFNMASGTGACIRNVKVELEPFATYGEMHVAVCDGETAAYAEGQELPLEQLNQYGADSLLVVHLDTLPKYLIQDDAIQMYVGAERTWRERDLSMYPAGIYSLFDSLKTEAGCDSVYCVALTIAETPVTYGEYAASVCQGDSVEYDGVWYYGAFADSVTLSVPNQFGGDSIVALTVTELLPTRYEFTDTIQAGDVYEGDLFYGLYVSGTYSDTITNEVGCDSIVTLTLVVETGNPGVTTEIEQLQLAPKAEKFFRNGQLYIRRGDEEYLIDGRRK